MQRYFLTQLPSKEFFSFQFSKYKYNIGILSFMDCVNIILMLCEAKASEPLNYTNCKTIC